MSWPALLLWVLTFLNADVRVWTGGLDYLSDCSLNMQLQCSWDTVVIFLSERKHSAASIYRAVLKLWPDWPDKEDNQLCMLGPLSPVHFMASLFNFTQYIPRAMYSLSFSSHSRVWAPIGRYKRSSQSSMCHMHAAAVPPFMDA